MDDEFYDEFYDYDDWDDRDEMLSRTDAGFFDADPPIPRTTFLKKPLLYRETHLFDEIEYDNEMRLYNEECARWREDEREIHAQGFEKPLIHPRGSTWYTRRENRPSPRRNRGRKPRDRFERRAA